MFSALYLVGKPLVRQEGSFTLPAGSPGSNLIFLQDSLSNRKFLVDSGASVSVFPHHSSKPSSSSVFSNSVELRTADGSSVRCAGTREIPLCFGSRRFSWSFQLAPVTVPILGADFLRHHHLLVDVAGRRVLDSSSLSAVGEVFSSSPESSEVLHAALLATPSSICDLLTEFPDVLSSDGFTAAPPKHGIRHHLQTNPGPPVFAKSRRLDPEKLEIARLEFAEMEKAGIVRRSSSPWSSPLHMVRKKDGGWRPCGDYRRLNNVTIPDRYPLPNIADFTSCLDGSSVFSKLDLQKGYYQVPMSDSDIQKTAIITPFGMFEFLRLPFGLRNAGQTFQRMMDQIFGDLPFCFVYVDDILVFSKNISSHVSHLREVFELCRQHGLTIGLPKCEFAVSEIEFLGHRVSASGCTPLSKHTDVIKDFPVPSDKPALQRFLGLLNFYRRFMKNAAGVLAPLTNALKGPGKSLIWSEDLNSSFIKSKQLLLAVPSLVHPVPQAPISLAVDASNTHIGAVLQQKALGLWSPLAFFSRKLSLTEEKYSAFDRELLAAYSSIRYFRFLLEGRSFTLFTDHKPLTHALFRTSPPWSARQQRHLAYISEFTSTIIHVPGADNPVADALSRPCSVISAPSASSAPSELLALPASLAPLAPKIVSEPLSVLPALDPTTSAPLMDFKLMAQLQDACPSVKKMLTSSSLKVISVPVQDFHLLCDVSTGTPRPLVPTSLRQNVFSHLHAVSHPGIRASRRLVSSRFVWPGLSTEVASWAKACLSCQQNKIQKHIHTPVEKIPVPGRRFSHVHLDLVGPLPNSQGFTYVLTMIDRTSRWPEVVPLSSITAVVCAQALLSSWISRFGVPSVITTDRGAQFTSSVWSEVCSILGIRRSQTTSYHPQSNGLIERFHRSLKTSLRARLAGPDWIRHLPLVLLGLRSVPKDDTGMSVAEAVYGTPLTLPGDFLDSAEFPPKVFIQRVEKALAGFSSASHHIRPESPKQLPPALLLCEYVFVREDAVTPPLSTLQRSLSSPQEIRQVLCVADG